MIHHQQESSHEEQRPQHDSPSRHTVITRLFLPIFSAKYKTEVTAHCLLDALSSRVIPADIADDSELQLLHETSGYLWKPPAINRVFDIRTFFSLYHAPFARAAPLLFQKLRSEAVFGIDEAAYQYAFTQPLQPVDSLGFSGSLFFFTADGTQLVKSIGRKFEYTFLYEKMLEGYAFYVSLHGGDTLLCRIMDVVYTFHHRIGAWLGVSPSHYIVMKNTLHSLDTDRGCQKWDLKPPGFFEPTRDLVPDSVKTEAAKSGLADQLEASDKILLDRRGKQQLMGLLERDTEFLKDMRTIDYSLLLGRYPVAMFSDKELLETDFAKGVKSADGKWVYRMCLLDFLWNVDQLRPKVMKTAGKILPEQTITTEPEMYREAFLKMMDEYIVVPGKEEDEISSDEDYEHVEVQS